MHAARRGSPVLRYAAALFVPLALAGCDSMAPDPAAPGAAAYAAAARNELFTEVAQPRLNPRQEALLETIRARPTTAEVRVARLATAPAAMMKHGAALGLTLGPDRRFVAVGERVRERGPQSVSWRGTLQSDGGATDLVLSGDGVTGALRADGEVYAFEPLGGGLQAIVRVDPGKLPPEHPAEHPAGALVVPPHAQTAVPQGPLRRHPREGGESGPVGVQTQSGPDIDLLVLYTPSAASAHGNIGALVQQAVDETNASYVNSDVFANVALAHAAQVSYTEGSSSHQQHLSRVQSWTDGVMDNIHQLRNQYLADVVVLIVNDDEACGLASQIRATGTTAFAVVHYNCIATSNYSFAHEVGHLQAARHDRQVDSNNAPFQWGHGYVDPNDQWRTIMAYADACNHACWRVNYWSNPYVTHPVTGQAMGTVSFEDNARVLNYTKYDVRDFRTLQGPYDFTLTNEFAFGNAPHFTWSRVPGAYTTVYRCVSTGGYYFPTCFSPTGSDEEEFVDRANWHDYEYRIAYSWGPCNTTAIYYVTATDRTGESSGGTQYSLCVE